MGISIKKVPLIYCPERDRFGSSRKESLIKRRGRSGLHPGKKNLLNKRRGRDQNGGVITKKILSYTVLGEAEKGVPVSNNLKQRCS